jgi:[acyl-carrier-protein] S-malonyltransferase
MTAFASGPAAFVFPGQGSQYPGMGRELARCGPAALARVPAAERLTGLPLGELMNRADARTIADPQIAQLVVFVWSGVLHRQLDEDGHRPAVVAGHSLGEYSALVACGSLDWEDGLSLVAARGRAMADAARRRPGAMAAVVGLPVGEVGELCRAATAATTGADVAVLANLNSPRQAVVSGTEDAVVRVVESARAAGALRAKRLPVGGAYHSPLMAPAEQALAPLLRAAPLRPPRTPLVSSLTGKAVACIETYRGELLRQITRPVRWQDTVASLTGFGVRTFVEVGPGRVLTGLNREMARRGRHLSVDEARQLLARPDARKSA